ncbi:pleckstrin homology domain-containing family F member 2-like [Oncorhynchus nerka]|uniref:pleckstrin homology domain-containing family F member 2-like n=1 Tax=Oncorhynchus nerka TaxID=8023 RepID=UPI001131BC4F|nr:pleckstrin homology domain-containing family F member 2-like [Oncorhynchus nerka]
MVVRRELSDLLPRHRLLQRKQDRNHKTDVVILLIMVDQLAFTQENRERIQAVENSFGPSGMSLIRPDRVLIGEGRLMKLCRRRPQPKVFFLFNDILVYGSIILHGRWHKNQHVISLEDIQLEDLEDGVIMENQWLIRTPQKSFYVAAASAEEKRAWMEHIEDCRCKQLQHAGCQPGCTFATTWIPDRASAICMRCSQTFRVNKRRHHCRRCGFVVCNACSKNRAVICHISTKPVRVCRLCHLSLQDHGELTQDEVHLRGDSDGRNCSDESDLVMPEYEATSDDEANEWVEHHAPSNWVECHNSWSPFNYLKPAHQSLNLTGLSSHLT